LAITLTFVLTAGLIILTIISKGHISIKKERWELANDRKIGHVNDADMMYRAKPGISYKWSDHTNNDMDTAKVITIDSLQRRITPHDFNKHKHAIFFGCSYTFGDGLSDEHTIPYRFGQLDTIYNAYNYALSGYGTAQMLEILQKNISSEIPEKEGIGLYILIDHHKDRITDDPYTMIWGYDFPKYSLDEHLNLQREGTFYERSALEAMFWKGFGEWNLWKPILNIQKARRAKKEKLNQKSTHPIVENKLNYQFANQIELKSPHDHKYLLMSKIIKAAETLYLQQFPKGQFYVIIFPGESTAVLPFLEISNLKVLNLSESLNVEAINGRQRDGYHPNEIGADAVAKLFQEQLDDLGRIY
jgi:hypothetical protein